MLRENRQIDQEQTAGFHETMELLFIGLCKELDIPVPIWLKKKTKEMARYKKTYFPREQFVEDVFFDTFVLEIEV